MKRGFLQEKMEEYSNVSSTANHSGYETSVQVGEGSSPTAMRWAEFWRRLYGMERRDEAVAFIMEHFPTSMFLPQVQTFLRTRISPPPCAYVPDFEMLPWNIPSRLKEWKESNFPVRDGVVPVPLVIIGPPRCGKTTWAQSFGMPAVMIGGWDVERLMQTDITHLVLNNVKLGKKYVDKLKLAGCEPSLTVEGKYRPEVTVPWGKPVIWICDEGNSVLKSRDLGPYLRESAVVVTLDGRMF